MSPSAPTVQADAFEAREIYRSAQRPSYTSPLRYARIRIA